MSQETKSSNGTINKKVSVLLYVTNQGDGKENRKGKGESKLPLLGLHKKEGESKGKVTQAILFR